MGICFRLNMADNNSPKIEYFESFAEEIASKFGRLKHLVERHNPTQGDYHEEILRVVLRNFLSKRFSVKKGFIYAGPNPDQISRQIDIIIIDENSPTAYIFQEGDFAIVAPEAVVAVVEVKTTLNKSKDFIESLENIYRAKSLMNFANKYPANLTGILFAYRGTVGDKRMDNWFRNNELQKFQENEVMAPEAIMFFNARRSDNGLLVRGNQEMKIEHGGKYYYPLIGGKTEIKSGMDSRAARLSFILYMIQMACEHKEFLTSRTFKNNTFQHTDLERTTLLKKRFTFIEGLLPELAA